MNNSSHYCEYCGKKYTRKTSHIKHTILCEVFHKSKREKTCDKEESSDIPTTEKLYEIIQELALKYKIMETKMENMQKWVDKKKKKLNVLQWLNTCAKPQKTYTEWIQSITATEEHVEILIEQNITQTVDALFNKKIQSLSQKDTDTDTDTSISYIHPIYCFVQKINIFYIYDDVTSEWKQMDSDDLISLSKKIHSKILQAICEWYKKNIDKINKSDKMTILYNQTLVKLMSVNFTADSVYLSKLKTSLHSSLKTDLTNIVEYEFEF